MKKIYTLLFTIIMALPGFAQTGIGTTTPNPDASLELGASDKGLLLNRVALIGTADPAPLSAHVAGMTVYNTATAGDVTPGYYYNNGTQWVRIKDSDDEPLRNVSDGSGATNVSTDIYYNGGNVGIGTITPTTTLDINGQVKITDGTQGAGKVLSSDAAGGASWQNPLAGSMIEGTIGNLVNVPSGTSLTYSGGSITFPRAGTYMVYARWRMLSPSTTHPSGTHAFVNTALSTSDSNYILAGIAAQWVFVTNGAQNTAPGFRVTVTSGQTLYFWFHTGFFAGDLDFRETYAVGPF